MRSINWAISPDDETVAIGARRFAPSMTLAAFYVEAVNARNGAVISKWHLDQEGLALSPKGRLMAIGTVQEVKEGWQPTAHIYDVASGKKVATVVHDAAPRDKYLGTSLSRGMSFTADGRYFVTSANNKVKIWEVAYR